MFRRKTWGSQDKWASLMSMQNNNNKSLVFDTGIPRNILRQILFIFRSSWPPYGKIKWIAGNGMNTFVGKRGKEGTEADWTSRFSKIWRAADLTNLVPRALGTRLAALAPSLAWWAFRIWFVDRKKIKRKRGMGGGGGSTRNVASSWKNRYVTLPN